MGEKRHRYFLMIYNFAISMTRIQFAIWEVLSDNSNPERWSPETLNFIQKKQKCWIGSICYYYQFLIFYLNYGVQSYKVLWNSFIPAPPISPFIADAMLKMEQIYIELLNFPSLSSLVLFYFYCRLLISCIATSPFHE